MELVTIVIPTYGGGEHLKNTIDSIIDQDYNNIEIIVVDDNGIGTENQIKTQEIIYKYNIHTNFKYIMHEENMNGSVARNTGAKESKGKYIGFIDDDDRYLSGKISYQVHQLDNLNKEWGASYCSKITKLDGYYISRTIAKQSGNLLYKHLMHKVAIGTGSMLVRKSAWEELGGYDESFNRHQDWEFVGRLASKYKIAAAPSVYFERNFTFRNNPKTPEKTEKLMHHFIGKLDSIGIGLSSFQKKKIISNNYMGIALKYLRNGDISKFIDIYLKFGYGILGVWYIFRIVIEYLVNSIQKKKGIIQSIKRKET